MRDNTSKRIEKRGGDTMEVLRNNAFRQAMRAGYHDAIDGKPLRGNRYEMAPPILQRLYETGRLVVMALRCRGVRPPAWPPNVIWPSELDHVTGLGEDVNPIVEPTPHAHH